MKQKNYLVIEKNLILQDPANCSLKTKPPGADMFDNFSIVGVTKHNNSEDWLSVLCSCQTSRIYR